MHPRAVGGSLVFILLLGAGPACASRPKVCVGVDEAFGMMNRDVCIAAHVYEVVQLQDGTRFLDICAPDTPDERCRFTIVSFWEDRAEVGELGRFRDVNVEVRGVVRPMHGRAGMVVSHARQFYGGPPKFRPNQRLARGFTGAQERPPLADPNLRSHGRGRGFMSSRDRETLPRK